MGEKRGSIAFFSTFRPPVPLDIFSCPVEPSSRNDELKLTDGESYNYNGQVIPPAALKTIINRRPKLAFEATEVDVDSGRLTGFIFVSERDNNLETLHIALCLGDQKPKAFSLADVYGTNSFTGVRMEDNPCFGGGYMMEGRPVDHFLIYVSTKEPVQVRRCPWTVVYQTNLRTGETERLTPPGIFDLSPSVSPSGKKVAVASFQGKGWNGETEDLQTDIYVMNVDQSHSGLERRRLIVNGGWPTWGSENVLYFHRNENFRAWRVFRYVISTGETIPITPNGINAVTPAAINETKVAVATIREKSWLMDKRGEAQYRHIEIFDTTVLPQSLNITQKIRPMADHFNPFVIDAGQSIGYHRCNIGFQQSANVVPRNFDKLHSPHNDIGLFRVPCAFPTFSKDGKKLAFVNNEFNTVWVADSQGLRIVYQKKGGGDNCFSPVWNQNRELDILYVCMGPSFHKAKALHIIAIHNASSDRRQFRRLTKGNTNNAFPSTDPEDRGEFFGGKITRLTGGPWTDTHCQWSPKGDWIVFSSTRDKPHYAPLVDNGLDPGYFAVYLANANDPTVVVRVIQSRYDIAGHVNYPVFSPDGKSIAVSADLAAVSVDPISLPRLMHSIRPYGDIFTIDIDPDDISKNKDVSKFHRLTHSRYENGTPSWAMFSTEDANAQWKGLILNQPFELACPSRCC